jgi:hypothetical protein
MGDRRGTYRVMVGRYEGKKTLGRSSRRWEQILKLIFKNWEREHGLDTSGSVGYREVAGCFECGYELSVP